MTLVCFIFISACSSLLNENDLKTRFSSGFWNNIGELTAVSVINYLLKLFMKVRVPCLLSSCYN